ncbi:MAG: biotin transporter BioY [Planctomycetota bacterium]
MQASTAVTQPTLADLAAPRPMEARVAYHALLIAGGALVIALAAQARIPTPWGIPFTLQTLAVMVLGFALGPWRGVAAVGVYIVAGLAGVGVFTVAHPVLTVGYIIAYLPAAFIAGTLAHRGFDRSYGRTFVAMLVSALLVLALGAIWIAGLAVLTDRVLPSGSPITLQYAAWGGFAIWVPVEIVKAGVGATLLPLAWKLLNRNAS